MEVTKKKLDIINNRKIYSIKFKNKNNYAVTFYNLGGYIHQIFIPYFKDPSITEDVLLGYGNLEDCNISNGYFNAIIGRVAGRISNAKFSLKNKEHKLYANTPPNHLHGGNEGFNKKIWLIESINEDADNLKCTLSYLSTHMEENYPGNLKCRAIYSLNNDNEFSITFEAESDQHTIVNITNHNYWNFHGHKDYFQNITNHSVLINANKFCEIDKNYIPTGKLSSVKNTKYDFNSMYNINQKFLDNGGIDHNYVLKNSSLNNPDGIIFSNLTGMGVEYFTDQPGLQFYTGNMMDKNFKGKYNKIYKKNFGLCLEPQIFPDAINNSNFPSTVINSGEIYRSKIIMKLKNDFIS